MDEPPAIPGRGLPRMERVNGMTRADHYQKAERLLLKSTDTDGEIKVTVQAQANVAAAKVHALLATAPVAVEAG